MKYIKLFEGFESDAISSVLSHLKKNLGKSYPKNFLNKLKDICKDNDIPLSSLNNNEIKYMSATRALKIKSDEEVPNLSGIYCLKFLFSLTEGYIGTLGTGNLKMNYEDLNAQNLNKKNIEKLIEKGYEGKLSPIKFDELKTGDKVFVCLHTKFIVDKFTVGEIYLDDRDKDSIMWYVLQNTAGDGSNLQRTKKNITMPDKYNIDLSDCEYTHYYRLGYNSYDEGMSEDTDHCYLYSYTPNNGVLEIDVDEKNIEHIWDYNFKYSAHYNKLVLWDNKSDIYEYKNADYAVVLYLDDVMGRLLEGGSRTDITSHREKQKKDALALSNNDDIKNQNINRYLDILYKKLDITANKKTFNNFNKFITKTIGDKYFCLVSYETNPLSAINDITSSINNLFKVSKTVKLDDSSTQYYYDVLREKYIQHSKRASNNLIKVEKNIDFIKNFKTDYKGLDYIIKITNKMISIGDDIKKSILSNKYETLNDIRFLSHTLESIKYMLQDYVVEIKPADIYYYINYDSQNSLRNYLSMLSESYTEAEFEEDMEKLELFEAYIKKLF